MSGTAETNKSGGPPLPQACQSVEIYDSDDVRIPDNFFEEAENLHACGVFEEGDETKISESNKGVLGDVSVPQPRKSVEEYESDDMLQGLHLTASEEIHIKDVPARDERGRIINPDREADECVDLLLKLGCEVPNPSLTKANIIARIQEMQKAQLK